MKLLCAGVKILNGIGKASGQPFSMPRLFGLVPVENFKKEKVQAEGYGFEVSEIELDPACLPAFAKINFPATLDLETDVMPFMGEFKTVVVGIRSPAVKAA